MLVLRGELDIRTIQDLQDKIDDVMVPGVAIVLGMEQLTFLDSRAIHCFIKTCQVTRHRVVLRNATPAVPPCPGVGRRQGRARSMDIRRSLTPIALVAEARP